MAAPHEDPDGLDPHEPLWWHDALFWNGSGGGRHGINVWTPSGGPRPFIRWVGDAANRGAADIGTDGVDLVWNYGEGGIVPGTVSYATRSIMTSPFTTDGATAIANARRLRGQPDACMGCSNFYVACGYAIRKSLGRIIVIRLSDGWAWFVPSVYPEAHLTVPIGMTCDEVFVQGRFGSQDNIARIRLDAMGPGVPPD